jgi:hypothetical protein
MINFDELVLGPCMDTFGEVNQGYPAPFYMPKSAGSYVMKGGIFDPSYTEIKLKDGIPVTVLMPVLGCRDIDFVGTPVQGDRVQLRGKTYDVREVRIDGHGGIELMLNLSPVTE